MGPRPPLRLLTLAAALFVAALISPSAWGLTPAQAAVGGRSESGRPVTVWHIPHPDDETLGMAGGIMAAAASGERNIVVLYTQGGHSDVRLVLNGLIYCRLHRRYHNPAAEGYEHLDVGAFKAARIAETMAALRHLGIDEDDVILLDFDDGALQLGQVFEVMVELDRLFPGARHRTTSVVDRHQDHKTLARALYRLRELKSAQGVELDVAFYRVYHYGTSPLMRGAARGVQPASVEDPERKRRALAEFGQWEPESGRFAIGMHSVPGLFRAAADDEHEYLDASDALPLFGLRSTGRLSVSLFPRVDGPTLPHRPRVGLSCRGAVYGRFPSFGVRL